MLGEADVSPTKAILFDLDDTLTDRRASIACYAQRFASSFGGRMQDPVLRRWSTLS